MSRQLQVACKLEMRAVVRFLWERRKLNCENCTEMYRQLREVHGEDAMSRQAIAKWCNMFEKGRTDIDTLSAREDHQLRQFLRPLLA
ncbi:hypothetical protein AVEN_192306-1 [Araneus ventricosus]|uniref:Mos1 transposase HTH domain-containing protein n=1 Tax=Araneus ventricosus TaxID=182803 RepID=A0A4Y2JMK3_ARAVE|nr:hypothetical protein AVEN_192306-1 [Araneus ventricosus]